MKPSSPVRFLLALACLLLLRGPTAAQQPKADRYADEYKALLQEYNKATEAFYAPYRNAKTDEERSKVVLDPKKLPDKSFFPRL